MAYCYLTGVQFSLQEGYVLNRREAHQLLRVLKDRTSSLQRLVDQLSPLDETLGQRQFGGKSSSRKRHRLICKAVAEALAPGYPETKLFLPWPDYREKTLLIKLQNLRGHPLYGSAIEALTDKALLEAAVLGNRVVRMLDPLRTFPQQVRIAIKAGICVHHHASNAAELVHLIRSAIVENSNLGDIGVPEEAQKTFLSCLSKDMIADSIDHRAKPEESENECAL